MLDRKGIIEALRKLDRHLSEKGTSMRKISLAANMEPGALAQAVRNAKKGVSTIKPDRLAALYDAAGLAFDLGGMAEAPAAWEPLRAPEPGKQLQELMAAARKAAPNVRMPLVYPLPDRMAAAFGMEAGAALVIDESAKPRAMDLVLATIVDQETGSADTYLGRYAPPYLIGPDVAKSADAVVLIDETSVWIKGPVVATI